MIADDILTDYDFNTLCHSTASARCIEFPAPTSLFVDLQTLKSRRRGRGRGGGVGGVGVGSGGVHKDTQYSKFSVRVIVPELT